MTDQRSGPQLPAVVALVSCDTTGVEVSDMPISIAVALVTCNQEGEWREVARWHGLEAPSVAIAPEATAIHGLTADSLQDLSFDVGTLRELLARAEAIVSQHPAFDAKMLAKILPDMLEMKWYAFDRHFTREQASEPPSDLPRALRQVDYMRHWANARGGSTTRSKTWLTSLLLKGRMPVHAHLAEPLPLRIKCATPTGRVFTGTLAQCRIGTRFRLWTRPGMDYIAAYATGHINGEGLAFHLTKRGNEVLARGLEERGSANAQLTDVQGFTYVIEIGRVTAQPHNVASLP